MSAYYRVEVKRANPLTLEEEAALFTAYLKRKTVKRREEIVRQYLYWAAELACRYCGPRMPREDAISAANLGLMQAIEDFNPALGRRFVTHSYFAIRRSVLSALRDTYVVNPASGVNVARHQYNLSPKAPEDLQEFLQAKRKIFDRAGSTKQCHVLEHANTNAPKGSGAGDPKPDRFTGGTENKALESDVEERDSVEDFSMLVVLRSRIANLHEPEKTILTMRYLSEDTPHFKEIGKTLKRTEDNVRYLHNRALAKLRASLSKERHLP